MNRKILALLIMLPVSLAAYGKQKNDSIRSIHVLSSNIEVKTTPVVDKNKENDNVPKNNKKENKTSPFPREVNSKENNSAPAKIDNLSTEEKNWFYEPKKDGSPSGEPADVLEMLKKYSGYYLGDTSKKVIYLTFDEGYENGYTSKILDALKVNDVKAAFFVTTDYINRNKDLIKRMVDEGHLVCNHSNSHPSMAQAAIKDKTKFEEEFTLSEKAFEKVTGKKMPKFFRPPMGKYSELSMNYTQNLGYKTIFWSFAYKDWIPEQQPSHEYAKKIIMERTHNGGIFLLHAVSKTNSDIMDSIIKEWKCKGFEFKTLSELP